MQQLLENATKAYLRGWAALAVELIDVKQTRKWEPGYNSLSDYVRAVAKALQISLSLLWRYIRVFTTYESIAQMTHCDWPDITIGEISARYSPDCLELLDKLGEVMPVPLYNKTCKRYLTDGIARNELRALWLSYRTALEDTAPRRRTDHPVKRIVNVPLVKKAEALSLIQENSRILFPIDEKPLKIRFITPVEWEALNRGLDAIMVVHTQKLTGAHIEIHGFHVVTPTDEQPEAEKPIDVTEVGHGCDYLWIVVHGSVRIPKIKGETGIIAIANMQATVEQPSTYRLEPMEKQAFICELVTHLM